MSEQQPRTFVEVGLGAYWQLGYGPGFPFQRGDRLVCVDLPYDTRDINFSMPPMVPLESLEAVAKESPDDVNLQVALSNARMLHGLAETMGVSVERIFRAGQELPLEDSTVTQVLMSNVIGDFGIPDDVKDELLAEAQRVITPGGLVVASEVTSPAVAQEYFDRQTNWPVTRIDFESITDADDWFKLLPLYNLFKYKSVVFLVNPPDSGREAFFEQQPITR